MERKDIEKRRNDIRDKFVEELHTLNPFEALEVLTETAGFIIWEGTPKAEDAPRVVDAMATKTKSLLKYLYEKGDDNN